MVEVFFLDINDLIDEEDFSEDEFEEVGLVWMSWVIDIIVYNENIFLKGSDNY